MDKIDRIKKELKKAMQVHNIKRNVHYYIYTDNEINEIDTYEDNVVMLIYQYTKLIDEQNKVYLEVN